MDIKAILTADNTTAKKTLHMTECHVQFDQPDGTSVELSYEGKRMLDKHRKSFERKNPEAKDVRLEIRIAAADVPALFEARRAARVGQLRSVAAERRARAKVLEKELARILKSAADEEAQAAKVAAVKTPRAPKADLVLVHSTKLVLDVEHLF